MKYPYSLAMPIERKRRIIASLCPSDASTLNYSPSSTVWPTANKAFFFPFVITTPTLVTKGYVVSGTAVAGNLDIGIWAANINDPNDAILLVSSGSVAQAGTSTAQAVELTDTMLGPGLYWGGLTLSDATTATVSSIAVSIEIGRASGFKESTGATIPLSSSKATVTLSSLSVAVFPSFGFECGQIQVIA